MKKLTLLRHAKSSWDDPVDRDFDRPLNNRGRTAAAAIGKFLKREDLHFDHVLSSPAVRNVQTLDHVEEASGLTMQPEWDRRIYLASSATLLDVLRGVDGGTEHLLMVGHNPGMEDLVFDLVPESPGSEARKAVEEKYPTAALAELELAIDDWAKIAEGCGTIIRFTRPRDLAPELGPEYS